MSGGTVAWDQVLNQILFAFRCYLHTSTGEAPYTLLYHRDHTRVIAYSGRELNNQ